AIYKAQHLAREQERAWITTAQLQVAEAIGRNDDRDEMLAEVARLVPILAGVHLCAFLLWHADNETYYGSILIDDSGNTDELFPNIAVKIGEWGSLDAVHVGCMPLTTSQIPAWLRKYTPHCLRLMPLISGQGKNMGVM